MSRPAVLVAAASSCAVVLAAAFGALSTLVVAAALGAAGAAAVLSYREARPEHLIHALRPLDEPSGPVVIRAPKAGEVAGAGQRHTDAA